MEQRAECKPELERCTACTGGKSHFSVIRLTPISGFKCHTTWSLRQPARWMSIIASVNWKRQWRSNDVFAGNSRDEGRESCRGFISVWLLAVELLIPDPGPAANHWSMWPEHPSTHHDRWPSTGQRRLALLPLVQVQRCKSQVWQIKQVCTSCQSMKYLEQDKKALLVICNLEVTHSLYMLFIETNHLLTVLHFNSSAISFNYWLEKMSVTTKRRAKALVF